MRLHFLLVSRPTFVGSGWFGMHAAKKPNKLCCDLNLLSSLNIPVLILLTFVYDVQVVHRVGKANPLKLICKYTNIYRMTICCLCFVWGTEFCGVIAIICTAMVGFISAY